MIRKTSPDKLLEVSSKVAENRKLAPVLDFAIRTVFQLFDAEYGYFILILEDGAMDFRVCRDFQGNELEEPQAQINATILQQAIQQGEAFVMGASVRDEAFQASKGSQPLQPRSVMCVPLISRGQIMGVLYLENRTQNDLFVESDLVPMKYFASQVAIAIENALLNEELEARASQRTTELLELNRRLEEQIKGRKEVEGELRKLSSAVEQSPSSIIITNTKGQIEYVNPAFEELTGYKLSEVFGKNPNFQKSGQTPEHLYRELWESITAGKTWRGEFVNRKKNGDLYWEFAVIAPIRNEKFETTHYVAIKEDITARKLVEEELKRLATLDPLTGIYNRRHLFKLGETMFEQAKRYERNLSVLMIDADHFKQVNDQFGHSIGDQVLQTIANYLTNLIRKPDLLGRYGGEEFIIIMPETSLLQAKQAAERLLEYMNAHPIHTDVETLPLTLSIGVATYEPQTTLSLDKLVDQADKALYDAKETGRNCVAVYEAPVA